MYFILVSSYNVLGFGTDSLSLQVDFGCGSGSLLDSLLLYPTSLEKIVGVDISKRSLARAAKVRSIYCCGTNTRY